MIKIHDTIITPTIFPDKTSQIWKIPEELLQEKVIKINWDFQSEVEVIHIAQLCDLIRGISTKNIHLICNYLPYARQHKSISNNTTFALHTFLDILNSRIDVLETVDVHDPEFFNTQNYSFTVINKLPNDIVSRIILEEKIDAVVFPDKGAAKRYATSSDCPVYTVEKIRNPSDGKILEIKIPDIPLYQNLLVQDDLCDGGKTFIDLASQLYPVKPNKLILFVSHGIFSRGTQCLYDAGYSEIYTFKGKICCQE